MEHEIDTGDSSPIRCVPRRMSPQKMKKEEECDTEMLTCGQIEPSDSPWSSPVVLVTKKDGGTRFALPDHLEEIVAGSHPSLGNSGRQLLRDILFHYRNVFLAPGDPVTGRTTSVQHEILSTDARPVCCGNVARGSD